MPWIKKQELELLNRRIKRWEQYANALEEEIKRLNGLIASSAIPQIETTYYGDTGQHKHTIPASWPEAVAYWKSKAEKWEDEAEAKQRRINLMRQCIALLEE